MTPWDTSTGARAAVCQESMSSSLSMLKAVTRGMLVVSQGVGGGDDLMPSGPLKITPPDEDELSRARADGNRRPQVGESCPGRAARGAPKGERPEGR